MYLERPLPPATNSLDNVISLEKDKTLGLITLYFESYLIHHAKDNKNVKEIGDTFKILFGIVNTTKANGLENELLNLKMGDFDNFEGYIKRFKNLKSNIITSRQKKVKSISEYVSIAFNNLSPTFKSFVVIFYSIPLFMKNYKTPSLEEAFVSGNVLKTTFRTSRPRWISWTLSFSP